MVYAALIGTALNVVGQQRANQKANRIQRQGFRMTQQRLNEESQFASQQRGQLQAGLDAINQGFDDAKIAAANQGRAAQRRTLDREKERGSEIQSRLAGSGLLNSSVAANLQQGIGAQTDQRLQEIDSALAGVFSNLATQRAGAVAGQRNQLANFFAQRQQRRANLGAVDYDMLSTSTDYQPIDVGALVTAFQGLGQQRTSGPMGRRPPASMNLNTFA